MRLFSGVWLRPTAVLIGVYVAVLATAMVLLAPVIQNIDWAVFGRVSNWHAPQFSRNIAVVDLDDWAKNPPVFDRPTIATFLDRLRQENRHPKAVLIDLYFKRDTCALPNTPAGFCSALAASLDNARKAGITVYATVSQPASGGDPPTVNMDALDQQNVYDHLTGYGHTSLFAEPAGGLLYQPCKQVLGGGASVVWALPWRIADETISGLDYSQNPPACDPTKVEVIRLGPHAEFNQNVYHLKQNGSLPSGLAADGKYLIVGTLEHDPATPRADGRSNPEFVAWALSDKLPTGLAGAGYYQPLPAQGMLAILVPAFTVATLIAFIAAFQGLRRLRLQALRSSLPWFAAVAAAGFALAIFAGLEAYMLTAREIQPQVSLVVLSIVLAAVLCGERGREILFEQSRLIDAPPEESNDYDVFISYAHEEAAWVLENVYLPLKNARTADGRKLEIFFDTSSINVGSSWQDKISLAITGSRFVIPVYSEIYFQRPYCRFEIKRAELKWISEGPESRCVLPIMRGTPTILATVIDIQAVSVDERPDAVSEIVALILARLEARTPSTTAPAILEKA